MIFYTGSYTHESSPAPHPKGEGIGCFRLDPSTGNIKLIHYTSHRNSGYLAISGDHKCLYAVEEMHPNFNPKVFTYKIKDGGKLGLLNTQELEGGHACHLAIANEKLVVANYMTGNALSFPVLKDGTLGSTYQVIQHTGTGPNKERQKGPHVHMVYPFSNDRLFIMDLGIDTAKAYRLNSKTENWEATPEWDISVEPGVGARHMTMDATGNLVFILSELSGEIFVFENQGTGFVRLQKISFVPEGYKRPTAGAAVRMHPVRRFLFASCRESNTIAVFRIHEKSKMLSFIAHHSSEGRTPRDFNIDPTGHWLIVANQDSDSLVVFKIDQQWGTLKKCSEMQVGTPVNISWL